MATLELLEIPQFHIQVFHQSQGRYQANPQELGGPCSKAGITGEWLFKATEVTISLKEFT